MKNTNIFLSLLLLLLVSTTALAQLVTVDCGVERWAIKTLSDPDTSKVRFDSVIDQTVDQFALLPSLSLSESAPRANFELKVFRVRALAYAVKREDDGDLHVLLRDLATDATIISEIPNPDCPEVMKTSRGGLFRDAQRWVSDSLVKPTTAFKYLTPPVLVEIIGVGFIDYPHGQTGRSASNREIHPVLSMGYPAASGVEQDERLQYVRMMLSMNTR